MSKEIRFTNLGNTCLALDKLKEAIRQATLKLRAFLRVVDSDQFESLHIFSSEDDLEKLGDAVSNIDLVALKNWVQTHPTIKYNDMTTTRLREMAKNLGVPNYSRKERHELVADLSTCEHIGKVQWTDKK